MATRPREYIFPTHALPQESTDPLRYEGNSGDWQKTAAEEVTTLDSNGEVIPTDIFMNYHLK